MGRIFLFCVVLSLIQGCATYQSSMPDSYKGETARIQDTETRIDDGKADLFYLSHVDGGKIRNSRLLSLQRSYGQGGLLTTDLQEHFVPAAEQTITIVGRTTYAMPLRAMLATVYEVKGDIVFSPKPGAVYVIKGQLSDEESMVWLEDATSGEIVGGVEVQGSAKLGFFEK